MARPTRTFTGQEGQRATGSAGPDPIRRDFDAIFAMFNPEATLPTGEAGGIDASENMKAVQVDQNQAPQADAGKIPTLLSGIVNRIKAITGMPDWKNTPPTTLAGVHNQVNNITVDQSKRPESDTGNIQQLLSWIVNRLKAITGRDDWKDDPGVTSRTSPIKQATTTSASTPWRKAVCTAWGSSMWQRRPVRISGRPGATFRTSLRRFPPGRISTRRRTSSRVLLTWRESRTFLPQR